jgi:hypothetical protein
VRCFEACAAREEAVLRKPLLKRSRAKYAASDDSVAVLCAVSREHHDRAAPNYWFAFHPHQREFLAGVPDGYVALGCGSAESVLLIPFAAFDG